MVFEGQKAVLYELPCELGKTRVNILLLIAWVIHYLSTCSASGISFQEIFTW